MQEFNSTTSTDRLFNKRQEIRLGSDKFFIKSKTVREDLEYTVGFGDVGFEIVRKRIKTANLAFIFLLAFDVLYLGLLVSAFVDRSPLTEKAMWAFALIIFSALTLMAWYAKDRSSIFLTGGAKTIEIFTNRKNKEEVERFIEAVHARLRTYHKRIYDKLPDDAPFEIKSYHLSWLKQINAIGDNEHAQLLEELKLKRIID